MKSVVYEYDFVNKKKIDDCQILVMNALKL